jgi:hypothetical protein
VPKASRRLVLPRTCWCPTFAQRLLFSSSVCETGQVLRMLRMLRINRDRCCLYIVLSSQSFVFLIRRNWNLSRSTNLNRNFEARRSYVKLFLFPFDVNPGYYFSLSCLPQFCPYCFLSFLDFRLSHPRCSSCCLYHVPLLSHKAWFPTSYFSQKKRWQCLYVAPFITRTVTSVNILCLFSMLSKINRVSVK